MTHAPTTRRFSAPSRLSTFLGAGALAAGLLGPAAPAHAQPAVPTLVPTVDLVCDIAFQFTFGNAGLLAARADGATTFCVSPNGSASSLTANTFTATGTATASALLCQATITGTGNITWRRTNLTTTTSSFTFTVDLTGGTLPLTATITSGPLAGDTVTAAPGITKASPTICPNGKAGFTRIASQNATITFTH